MLPTVLTPEAQHIIKCLQQNPYIHPNQLTQSPASRSDRLETALHMLVEHGHLAYARAGSSKSIKITKAGKEFWQNPKANLSWFEKLQLRLETKSFENAQQEFRNALTPHSRARVFISSIQKALSKPAVACLMVASLGIQTAGVTLGSNAAYFTGRMAIYAALATSVAIAGGRTNRIIHERKAFDNRPERVAALAKARSIDNDSLEPSMEPSAERTTEHTLEQNPVAHRIVLEKQPPQQRTIEPLNNVIDF